jgi:hypothetical protein
MRLLRIMLARLLMALANALATGAERLMRD